MKKDPINLPDSFIAVDTETTGLSADGCEIIEIGAILVRCGSPAEEFSTLVRPREAISPMITALTGITNEMTRSAPRIDRALSDFDAFISESPGLPMLAHNAPFDRSFITAAYERVFGYPFGREFADTLSIARSCISREAIGNFKLGNLANYLMVDADTAHRALGDCRTTVACYFELKRIAERKQREE